MGIIISMFSVIAVTPHFLDLDTFHGVSRRQHQNLTEFSEKKCHEFPWKSTVFALQDVLLMTISVDIDFDFVF